MENEDGVYESYHMDDEDDVYETINSKYGTGVMTGIQIDGIGFFKAAFYPEKGCTYDDMIDDKKFVTRKFLEQLNKIYLFMEKDLDEVKDK